ERPDDHVGAQHGRFPLRGLRDVGETDHEVVLGSAFDVDGDAVCWHGTDVEVPSVGDAIFSLPPHPLFLARGTHRVEGGVGVEMIGDSMDVSGAVWCIASVAGELLDPSGAVVAVVVFV